MKVSSKVWVWYSRVSTEFQHVEAQRAAYKRFCEQHEGETVQLIEETVSGRKMAGQLLQQLRSEVAAGVVKGVACYSFDRLGRNVLEGLRFVDLCTAHGVKVYSQCEPYDVATPDGRMMYTVQLAMAEQFLGRLSENTRRGLAAAKARGTFVGGTSGEWMSAKTAKKLPDVLRKAQQGYTSRDIAKLLKMDERVVARIIRNKDNLPKVRPRTWDQ